EAPGTTFQVLTRAQTIAGTELAAVAEAALRARIDRWLEELGGGSLAFKCQVPDGLTLVDGATQVSTARVSGSPPGPSWWPSSPAWTACPSARSRSAAKPAGRSKCGWSRRPLCATRCWTGRR